MTPIERLRELVVTVGKGGCHMCGADAADLALALAVVDRVIDFAADSRAINRVALEAALSAITRIAP